MELVPALVPARTNADASLFETPGIDEFHAAIRNGEIVPHYQPQL